MITLLVLLATTFSTAASVRGSRVLDEEAGNDEGYDYGDYANDGGEEAEYAGEEDYEYADGDYANDHWGGEEAEYAGQEVDGGEVDGGDIVDDGK